ncbi:MAG: hypothetical protein C4540_02420 [Candidatus Omnitrophota bacterium]|jgi:hypothetical protein|nr:MAG: hypothetical protein C4540_02420 [Candidatus Omnitrophota bacterium]
MVFGLLAIVFLLAFITESAVEYVFGTPFNKIPQLTPYKWLLMYIALLVGVGLTFFYKLDLIAMLSIWLLELFPGWIVVLGLYQSGTWVGYIATGYAVGRGSVFVHDLASKYILKRPQDNFA